MCLIGYEFFFCQQKTAYGMRISDWSSDVCSSDLGREIPAVHYMIAAAGGPTIRVAPYATYGTAELSANALTALEGRSACLLANHGVVATGPDLQRALWLAGEVETLAEQYYLAQTLGAPRVLPDDEIARVVERSEEHTAELQSLMRTSYAVFCLK